MPIIESFSVDHTKMKAPAVRLSKIMTTPKGDSIKIFDLRFCQPNRAMMPEKGLHTTVQRRGYRHFPDGLQNRFLCISGRRSYGR